MTKYPNVSVKLILRAEGKVFMLRHRAHGEHDFPGGQMEWGETPEAALGRELQEELSFRLPSDPAFFGIWNYLSPDRRRHSVFLYYFIELPAQPVFDTNEDADPLWLGKDYFVEHWPDDHDRVRRMFAA